ncbi:TPA: restriction endonuclease subunit S [Neisseria subflava]
MNKQQEPRLRFQGFKDDWKEKTLGEVSDVFDGTHQTPNYKDSGIMFLSVENISTLTSNKFISENDFNKQFKIFPEKGDVLMTRIGDIGTTNVVTSEEFLAYYVSLALLKPKIVNPYFLSTVISSSETQSDINKRTLHVAFPKKINKSEIEKVEIKIPTLPEQTHLGLFFRRLDSQIAESRAVLEKSRQLKKAMLAKMFPANGEKIPKIRFKGFEGEWERKKLGEMADIVRGASPRPIQDPKWFDDNSDIGWLRISDVTIQNGRIHYLEQKISKAGQEKTRVLEEPHLLLSIAASVGKPVINYVKTGVHDGFLVFKNPNFELEFMFQYLDSFIDTWQCYGQPGTQVNLNSDIVKNADFFIPPNPKEQTAIGNFFRQLDETIALQSAEIEKLNQLKKGLLAAMLV